MHVFRPLNKHRSIRLLGLWLLLGAFLAFTAATVQGAQQLTVKANYPMLALGVLSYAKLEPLDGSILLVAEGIEITRAELMAVVNQEAPAVRGQLEKHLLFVLDQEATRRMLLNEADKAAIPNGGDDDERIQTWFEHQFADVSVSESELMAFYQSNREMIGAASFQEVQDAIRHYLLQEKKQHAVMTTISALAESVDLRVDASWVESQSRLALDNPVDQARLSNKPTLVEFGAAGCVPCDMMQPILEKLRHTFPEQLNVVFVHVGEDQLLAARYGVRSIPVQVFYDATGRETFRNVGFFPEPEVLKQLARIGVEPKGQSGSGIANPKHQ